MIEALSALLSCKKPEQNNLKFTLHEELFASFEANAFIFSAVKTPRGSLFSEMYDLLHFSFGSSHYHIHGQHRSQQNWKPLFQLGMVNHCQIDRFPELSSCLSALERQSQLPCHTVSHLPCPALSTQSCPTSYNCMSSLSPVRMHVLSTDSRRRIWFLYMGRWYNDNGKKSRVPSLWGWKAQRGEFCSTVHSNWMHLNTNML